MALIPSDVCIRCSCAHQLARIGRSRRPTDPESVIRRHHRREPLGPIGWGHAARGIELVESEHLGMSFPSRNERPRARSTASLDRLHPSDLMARRGMLLIVVTALVLTGAMVFVSGLATLR
jgi:hypothetical protein